jgi:hypothetical protein
MKRKYDSIDVLKLYAGAGMTFEQDVVYDSENATTNCVESSQALKSHVKWNEWLKRCLDTNNINELVRVKYGIQVGMDDVVKKKIHFNKLNELFVRWVRSIDKTAWQIIKKRNPMPGDTSLNSELSDKFLKVKRKRDDELFKFLQRTSF